jgi:hypothetical protein
VLDVVASVLALNLCFLAVGYAVLAVALRGAVPLTWVSYAGVALLVGAGLVGVVLFFAAIAGASTGPLAFAGVAVTLAAAGAVWALVSPRPPLPQAPPARRSGGLEDLVATAACVGLVAICALALVGGFRSSPWLDDVWGIWVPKGLALSYHGLDPRLFAPDETYAAFGVLHYPLWWSIVTGLDLRFVGEVDLRAVNGQLAILTVAFLAGAARLLWGHVRPVILWPALLLLAASPEFFRHAQGGLADLSLAIYLALYLLALAGWAATGSRLYLGLAVVFGATALQVKTEALPQVLLVSAFAVAVVWGAARDRLAGLLFAAGAVVATAVPWFLWRAAHDVEDDVSLSDSLDPSYLADRSERLAESAGTVARHLVTPREWLLVVPLLAALCLAGAIRERRAAWLLPLGLVGALYVFWVWVYWAHRDPLDYLLSTSSYRTIGGAVLVAWALVPLTAELLARRRT